MDLDSAGLKESRIGWHTDVRHLANTIERSVLVGDASCRYRRVSVLRVLLPCDIVLEYAYIKC